MFKFELEIETFRQKLTTPSLKDTQDLFKLKKKIKNPYLQTLNPLINYPWLNLKFYHHSCAIPK